MTPEWSEQMSLAREWASQLGNELIEAGGIADSKGNLLTSFGIVHGPTRLTIFEIAGVLGVNVLLGIPPEIRDAVNRLPSGLQVKMLETLKSTFLECPRAAWTLFPTESIRIGQVERIQLSELMRLDRRDIQTFNRYADAIQELTAVTVRATQVYSTVMMGGSGASGQMSPGVPGYG